MLRFHQDCTTRWISIVGNKKGAEKVTEQPSTKGRDRASLVRSVTLLSEYNSIHVITLKCLLLLHSTQAIRDNFCRKDFPCKWLLFVHWIARWEYSGMDSTRGDQKDSHRTLFM